MNGQGADEIMGGYVGSRNFNTFFCDVHLPEEDKLSTAFVDNIDSSNFTEEAALAVKEV
jgi:hypothetical protein